MLVWSSAAHVPPAGDAARLGTGESASSSMKKVEEGGTRARGLAKTTVDTTVLLAVI